MSLTTSTLIAHNTRPRYVKLYDQITLYQYDAFIPESYAPISEYDAYFGTKPAFEWDNIERNLSFGAATISQMIDMHANQMRFIIANAGDVLDIIQVTTDYITELDTIGTFSREDQIFKNLANNFLRSMHEEYRRSEIRAGRIDPDKRSISSMVGKLLSRFNT